MTGLSVVIPTQNRPQKLRRCLDALVAARHAIGFEAYVCDSSTSEENRAAVRSVCAQFDFVHLRPHQGASIPAARNFATKVAPGDFIISVDDDVYVEPDTVAALYAAYRRDLKPGACRVTIGTVCGITGGEAWSKPGVMRPIGHCRPALEGERPSFFVTALFGYPKALALRFPWNERMVRGSDRFAGFLWSSKGVDLRFVPEARAIHDEEINVNYGNPRMQEFLIYSNLFEALIAKPNLLRAVSYEFLGFAAGARRYCRDLHSAAAYLAAWYRGNRRVVQDWRSFKELQRRELPASSFADG